MPTTNHAYRLAARPVGMLTRDIWDYTEEPVAEPGAGEVLVRSLYLSLDPAMRGWLNDVRSYVPPVGIGEVMRAGGVGEVLESNDPGFAAGDHVYGTLGIQEYAVLPARHLEKVDPSVAPLPKWLSVLGITGLTAYFGLLDVCSPQEGETVVVSGAAGAVGTIVGQIAKIKGCRAVGIAGGPEKCGYIVQELGFDAAVDYKSDDVNSALREHCPDGIDVFFDNVGGDILNIALARLAFGARVAICGAISQYNNTTPPQGPSNYLSLLVHSATMAGFVVFTYAKRYPEGLAQLGEWVAEGKLKSREDIVEGIETFPESLLMLFSGENTGKLMLQVAAP
jgi:NADPH-dependent curcumin reductase CurA